MKSIFTLLLGAAMILSIGCGGDSLNTLPVKGTVLVDNAPVIGVKVIFIPDAKTKGPQGFGFTDGEGKYEIATAQGVKGLVPGDYKVLISKLALKPGAEANPAQGGAVPESDTVDEIPRAFSDPEMSQLTAKVEAGSKPFDFAVTLPKKKK